MGLSPSWTRSSEPTWVEDAWRVWLIAWMACWPDWKVRREPTISTIAVVGFAPDSSSTPWRTVPSAPLRGGCGGFAGEQVFALLDGVGHVEDAERARRGRCRLRTLIGAPLWLSTFCPVAVVSSPCAEVVNWPSRV